MKKYLFSMLAMATMLFAASCTQEDDFRGNDGNEVEALFTVELPAGVATRAAGDGGTVDKVKCVVYEFFGNGKKEVLGELTAVVDVDKTNKTATYNTRLIKGRAYRVVFFAYNEKADAYVLEDMEKIQVKSGQGSNKENRDAFTAYVDVKATESLNVIKKDVTLKRPFAQLNVGSTAADTEAARMAAGVDKNTPVMKQSYIKVTGVYNTFDAFESKAVGETCDMAFAMNDVLTESLSVDGVAYTYAAMNYILAGEKTTTNVSFNWVDAENNKNAEDVVWANVPLQRNYRTNILGSVLTNPAEFNITIDAGFEGDHMVVDDVAAANAAFKEGQTNVKIAEVKENDEPLVLPETYDRVSIELPSTEYKIDIKYPEDAAKKPEVVNITVPDGKNVAEVVVNAPESTVNIEGDVENIKVYSAPNTAYIKAGSEVGTVTVGQGNVVIEAGASVEEVVRVPKDDEDDEYDEDDYITVALGEGVVAPELGKGVYLLDSKIGDVAYPFLKAFDFVEDGGTITLTRNVTFTETNRSHNSGTWYDGLYYVGDKSFTIDLGGFTVTHDGAVNDYLFNFKNSGSKANTITLKNGTVDAGTGAFCALCTSSTQVNKLTINTEEINFINNISNGSTIKFRGNAVLNVKAGTVITGKNSYLGIECVGSTVNIYDGAEIYMNGTSSYNGCLAGVCYGGTLNVYGGYGKGVKGGFIAMTSGGTINVYGGEWIANTDGSIGDNSNLYVLTAQSNKNESGFVGASIINVTGGTFRGGMDAWVLNNVPEEKAELNICGGNFNADPTRYLADGFILTCVDGIYTVEVAAAMVGETSYDSLEKAFKAVTAENNVIEILKDITIDNNWDNRYTGSKFTVPVTINGNNKTIKFTASVNENNYQAPFRFEADATVNNLIVDMSETTDNRFRAISSKGNLTVAGCKFIGKDATLNARGVIFGEGAGTNVGNLAISITDCEFINWKRGITDNENGQDVKSVTVTRNRLANAAVYVSAYESVVFTDNTVEGAYVNICSYTADNALNVTATGNTLTENTDNAYNYIKAGGAVNAQDGFKFPPVAKIGEIYYATLAEAAAAAKAGDEIVLLGNATVEGTQGLPAGIKLTSNGYTIKGSIRMLGDLELNGGLAITGGLWVGKGGETLTATLSGDKLTASYFMFQHGNYIINADIDAVYGYLSYGGTFEVGSTIHTTGANGEVLYINGNVTLKDGAVLDSDNSVYVCNDNAVLTLKPASKVDSNVNITTSGAKLYIDGTGMTAGTFDNITGTVTNSGNGTIAVINNDNLKAKIVDGKIVLE